MEPQVCKTTLDKGKSGVLVNGDGKTHILLPGGGCMHHFLHMVMGEDKNSLKIRYMPCHF
jgi:hypothetical protein